MALVPQGMANGQGAVLNQYPPIVLSPFTGATVIPVSPTELSVLVVPPTDDVRRSFTYTFNVAISATGGPGNSSTKIRFQFRGDPPGLPWSGSNDSSTFIEFAPTAEGEVATDQSIEFGFAVLAGKSKYLYVSVIPASGDTTTYSILQTSVLTLQRIR